MSSAARRWARLGLGLAAAAGAVTALHLASGALPGSTGALISRNQREDVEVQAIFYSEVGDLAAFLDDESGRYARACSRLLGRDRADP